MRAIVYPHKVEEVARREAAEPSSDDGHYAGSVREATTPTVAEIPPDDYLARLAKHIPGEVLAIFLLASALLADQANTWQVAAVVFATIAAVVLDRERRWKAPEELRVRGVIYDLFVIVAFLGWAVGVSPMARQLIDLNLETASFVTIVVAFGLARIDEPVGRAFEHKPAKRRSRRSQSAAARGGQ